MMEVIVSTTPTLQGKRITSLGIVTGEAILGANVFATCWLVFDIIGGRSGAYEQELRKAKDIALKEMMDQARSLGATAVVGIDLDYETIGNSMLMVSASGTAVVCEDEQ